MRNRFTLGIVVNYTDEEKRKEGCKKGNSEKSREGGYTSGWEGEIFSQWPDRETLTEPQPNSVLWVMGKQA